MIRRGVAAVGAMVLAAMTALPLSLAEAVTSPNPRSDEWWFPAWTIQDKVWPLTRGAGVTVAVIDTGVNASLPGLRDVVLPGTNLDDGQGDGRTDTDAEKFGHGTQMAEFIAGQGQDDGMVGVAPEAKILPIVAGRHLGNIPDGIRYAADHGAKVINISEAASDAPIGGRLCPGIIRDAVAYAVRKDVVIVAGAGNDGDVRNDPKWPADCPGVLAVGAINGKKIPWTKTERQPYVSVAAPGIETTSVGRNGQLVKSSGTSDAAALTSAAIALIRSKNPSLSAREVVQRVINTAIDAGPPGHDVYTGYGVFIPLRAMNTEVAKNAPNPPYEQLDKYLAEKKQPSAGQATTRSSNSSDAKKSSNSGLIGAIVAGAVIVLIVVVVLIVLMRRRGKDTGTVVQEQSFPQPPYGQHPTARAPQNPYGGPETGGGDHHYGRPQGPPPSFLPPADRGDGPN